MSTPTPHPKADANGWIKFSENLPSHADPDMKLPVMVAAFFPPLGWSIQVINLARYEAIQGWTHWQHCIPPPPVAEKSQRDIDDEQCEIWVSHAMRNGIFSANPIWHAALAWERSRKDK